MVTIEWPNKVQNVSIYVTNEVSTNWNNICETIAKNEKYNLIFKTIVMEWSVIKTIIIEDDNKPLNQQKRSSLLNC